MGQGRFAARISDGDEPVRPAPGGDLVSAEPDGLQAESIQPGPASRGHQDLVRRQRRRRAGTRDFKRHLAAVDSAEASVLGLRTMALRDLGVQIDRDSGDFERLGDVFTGEGFMTGHEPVAAHEHSHPRAQCRHPRRGLDRNDTPADDHQGRRHLLNTGGITGGPWNRLGEDSSLPDDLRMALYNLQTGSGGPLGLTAVVVVRHPRVPPVQHCPTFDGRTIDAAEVLCRRREFDRPQHRLRGNACGVGAFASQQLLFADDDDVGDDLSSVGEDDPRQDPDVDLEQDEAEADIGLAAVDQCDEHHSECMSERRDEEQESPSGLCESGRARRGGREQETVEDEGGVDHRMQQ